MSVELLGECVQLIRSLDPGSGDPDPRIGRFGGVRYPQDADSPRQRSRRFRQSVCRAEQLARRRDRRSRRQSLGREKDAQ